MIFKKKNKNNNDAGLFKGIFTASLILLLHVVLLAFIGVIVLLFKGMYQYLPWVMIGFAILAVAVSWIIYERIKKNSSDIKDILSMPEFQDRNVDIKLLGGMASFKITPEKNHQALIEHHGSNSQEELMIENSTSSTERKILALKKLYKKKVITKKEFQKAKQDLLKE